MNVSMKQWYSTFSSQITRPALYQLLPNSISSRTQMTKCAFCCSDPKVFLTTKTCELESFAFLSLVLSVLDPCCSSQVLGIRHPLRSHWFIITTLFLSLLGLFLFWQFANSPNLDFDDINDQTPTQELVVPQSRDVGEYALKCVYPWLRLKPG